MSSTQLLEDVDDARLCRPADADQALGRIEVWRNHALFCRIRPRRELWFV